MTFGTLMLIFLIGLCIGSFLGVVIYRTLHGLSPYSGRSRCDDCDRQLKWFENIPLVSFIVLKGQCRTCKKKIDWSYPFIEFVTGVLFLWWATLGLAFFKLSSFPHLYIQPLYWLLVGILLVVIIFADWMYMIIPDFTVVGLVLFTLAYKAYLVFTQVMQVKDFGLVLLSGLVSGLIFLAIFLGTKGKGLGFGDVKFAVAMGLILGFPRIIVGIFLSFIVGAIWGLMLMGLGKKKFGQAVPFGPFLVTGLLLALLWGEPLWQWYMGILGV